MQMQKKIFAIVILLTKGLLQNEWKNIRLHRVNDIFRTQTVFEIFMQL